MNENHSQNLNSTTSNSLSSGNGNRSNGQKNMVSQYLKQIAKKQSQLKLLKSSVELELEMEDNHMSEIEKLEQELSTLQPNSFETVYLKNEIKRLKKISIKNS